MNFQKSFGGLPFISGAHASMAQQPISVEDPFVDALRAEAQDLYVLLPPDLRGLFIDELAECNRLAAIRDTEAAFCFSALIANLGSAVEEYQKIPVARPRPAPTPSERTDYFPYIFGALGLLAIIGIFK